MAVKDIVQIAITVGVVGTYLFLVVIGKAAVEGFAILATYVIKKFLDIVELNNGGGKNV